MGVINPIFIITNFITIVVGLMVVFINVLALCLILHRHRNWENAAYFITNLAVADGLTGFLTLTNVVYNLNRHQVFYECIFRLSAFNSVIFASVFILLGVTFDRYVKIIFPLRYITFMNETVVKVYLCIIWILSLILLVVPVLLWIHDDINPNLCSYFVVMKKHYLEGFSWAIFCALLLQLFMYVHIAIIAVSQSRKVDIIGVGQSQSQVPPRTTANRMSKPGRVVLTLVGINFIAILPVGIYTNLVSTNRLTHLDKVTQGSMLVYIVTPLYLISLINPCLYAFKIPDVKRTLSLYIPCLRDRVEPSSSSANQTNTSGIQTT